MARSVRRPPVPEFGSHEAYRFPQKREFRDILMPDRKLHQFIIITIIVPLEHDSAIGWEEVLGVLLGGSLAR